MCSRFNLCVWQAFIDASYHEERLQDCTRTGVSLFWNWIFFSLVFLLVWAGKAFRKFLPLFDRVLVERCAAETVTKGGIMIPEKAQGKVLQATVVAVGSGAKGKNGEIQPVSVKVGEKVLLPEYGGTKIVLDDKDYYLFRDGDILGKYLD
nr:10 kDa heat shock protein, mitochondrial isoform X2 [Dromaius novaehollandiae]